MSFKKLLISLALVAGFASLSQAAMRSYTMTVTTNTPTGSATLFTNGGYPNISGGVWLSNLVVTGNSVGGQTVTLYDTCTSSTAATAKMPLVMQSTSTVQLALPATRFKMTSPCIAVDGAASAFKATFFYE